MKKILILFISIVAIITSCQKEIDVDLNDTQPKLVLVANYSASDNFLYVHVSKTASYFDGFEENFISNAVVTVSENNGAPEVVPYLDSGYYVLYDYMPNIGSTYTVSVTYDGVTYTCSQKLNAPIQLSPSTYAYQNASIFNEEGYLITYNFNDPAQLGNAYRIITSVNEEIREGLNDAIILNDTYSNGNTISGNLRDVYNLNDEVIIELQTINMNVYNYYTQLSAGSGGFTAANGNPDFMWSNKALGYFSAYTYSHDTIRIE